MSEVKPANNYTKIKRLCEALEEIGDEDEKITVNEQVIALLARVKELEEMTNNAVAFDIESDLGILYGPEANCELVAEWLATHHIDEAGRLQQENEVLIAALKFYAEDGGCLAADANQGYAQDVLDGLGIDWTDPYAGKARKIIWTE